MLRCLIPRMAAPRISNRALLAGSPVALASMSKLRLAAPSSQVRAIATFKDVFEDLITRFNNLGKPRSSKTELVLPNDPLYSRPDLQRRRIVPEHPAFYMYVPGHEKVVSRLRQLVNQNINIPRREIDPKALKKAGWVKLDEYRAMVGSHRVTPRLYTEFTSLLNRLDAIDEQLMTAEVFQVLDGFRRSQKTAAVHRPAIPQRDELGRVESVGHRKSASAKVMVAEVHPDLLAQGHSGQIIVNGKNLAAYFPELAHRAEITYPLRVMGQPSGYNVAAVVRGGGISGQAGAIAIALAQALRGLNPGLGSRLRNAGCLTRDTRTKERKKPGLAGARKAYTWVKR